MKNDWCQMTFVMRLEKLGRVMAMESVEPQDVWTVPLQKYLKDYGNNKNP